MIARLRPKLAVPGATLFLQAARTCASADASSNAQYQYTLQGDNLAELKTWAPTSCWTRSTLPELRDVNTRSAEQGPASQLVIDRDTAHASA